jgi:hypothetical protein
MKLSALHRTFRRVSAAGLVALLAVFVLHAPLHVAAEQPNGLQLTVQDRNGSKGDWASSATAAPGDTVNFRVNFTNGTDAQINDVAIKTASPRGAAAQGGVKLYNDSNPNGVAISSTALASDNGANIGNYAKDANAYVIYAFTMPSADALECGENKLTATASVAANGKSNTASADVVVTKQCQSAKYSCDTLDVSQGDSRTVNVKSFKQTAQSGATFKNAVINWGDGSAPVTTSDVEGQKHQYAADGTYTVSAVAHFTVDGKDASANGPAACSKAVTFGSNNATGGTTTPTPPSTPGATNLPGSQGTSGTDQQALANSGPGDVIGIFVATTAVVAVAHRLYLGRRLARL